jgi:DNA-binding beta-propeller fold protein YncE
MNHRLNTAVQAFIAIIALVFFALPAYAAPLTDGMEALHVIGKATFEATSPTTRSSTVLANPFGITYDSPHNRLFVVDGASNAVLVYDLSGGITDGMAASHILGQTTMTGTDSGAAQNTLSHPAKSAYDPNHNYLFVSDAGSNRVLVFDVASITDGENAIHVLGQPNFTSHDPNYGDVSTNDQGLDSPEGLAYDEDTNFLYVADSGNNRVVVYDLSGGITDGMAASHVLGQNNLSSKTLDLTPTASNISSPYGITIDTDQNLLHVANTSSFHRVSVFNIASLSDGEAAVFVLGQSSFGGSSAASGEEGLNYPKDIAYDPQNERLFVVDSGNSRVLEYNIRSGITTGMAASHVLGQPDFDSDDLNYGGSLVSDGRGGFSTLPSNKGFSGIEALAWDEDDGFLFAADNGNGRVLVFDLLVENSAPTNISLSSDTIAEDQVSGTSIGTLSATDPDIGDTHTFSLTCDVPGADDGSFSISGDTLSTATALDYETKTSYSICIRATDEGAETFDKDFTITVTDVDDTPPADDSDTTPRSSGGGGGVSARCGDPRALNYDSFITGNLSRCVYKDTASISTPTPSTCSVSLIDLRGKTFRLGAKGTLVKQLQKGLNCKNNSGLTEDGVFGRGTDKAVREFQKLRGLRTDGVVGQKTIAELEK